RRGERAPGGASRDRDAGQPGAGVTPAKMRDMVRDDEENPAPGGRGRGWQRIGGRTQNMAENLGDGAGAKAPGGNGQARAEFVKRWRDAAYGCYSSGHKFCREVCPVTQVTRNENHSPTAFHANIVAMEQGLLGVADVAEDYVHCTQCGACELRCPNTLFTGDFYRFRQRTIDVVKAMRALAVQSGVHQKNWKRWAELTNRWGNEPVLGWTKETSGNKV